MKIHGKAPLHGTTSLYSHLSNGLVLIMKDGYQYVTINRDIFYDLYYELDDSKAALKTDCIDYAIYSRHTAPYDYPNWYVDAMVDGFIYEDGLGFGGYMFYDESGEMAMADGSVVLQNFRGELRHMEISDFLKYYELIGG